MKALIKLLIRFFLCKVFYKVKFINKEKEEQFDKCIICPNHSNTVEPAWIYSKTKDICIMAKAELFENKLFGAILKYFNVFPIKRGEHDVRSLIHAINLFKGVNKRKLLVFPEGERIKRNQEKGVAKVGPAYIAYKADIPIIPVYISKNVKLFSKVNIIYGDPIYVSKDIAHDKEKLKIFSDELLNKCYDLKKDV